MLENLFPYAKFEPENEIPFVNIDYSVVWSNDIGKYKAEVRIKNTGIILYGGIAVSLLLFLLTRPDDPLVVGNLIVLVMWTFVFFFRLLVAFLQCRPNK